MNFIIGPFQSVVHMILYYIIIVVLKSSIQQVYLFYIYQQIYDKIIAHEFCL